MTFVFSKHVLEELVERNIPRELVERVLQAPQQKVPEIENVTCYQSRVDMKGKEYLLRVIVNETSMPAKVITV
ncbi:MAG TPA: DUF4258 domain-containing protein [Nitrospira sp.]|nr:DUF4258 domain-containing protein [Nitrospira sp.]